MAVVLPFHGVLYNQELVGNLSDVVVQPYDKITPELQRRCYERSPYNFVRLNLGETRADDRPGESDRYTRARETLRQWYEQRVLYRAADPAFYVYHQEYQVPGQPETLRRRKGFIGLTKLERYGATVKAHEHTLEGPKTDRLNLMRATAHQFGLVFVLYRDPQQQIDRLFDRHLDKHSPLLQAVDQYSDTHRVWPVTDRELCRRVSGLMSEQALYIADGHHRYETALAYRDEQRAAGVPAGVAEGPDYRLMCFVNMADEGLTILPTHRLLRAPPPPDFVPRLAAHFETRAYPFQGETDKPRARLELLEDLRFEGLDAPAFGLALAGAREYRLLSARDPAALRRRLAQTMDPALAALDVSVLHRVVLDEMLGIDAPALAAGAAIGYERGAETALDAVEEGRAQAAFLLNPTRLEQLAAVAGAGQRMPQKSTDFFPKLLSGLVSFQMQGVRPA